MQDLQPKKNGTRIDQLAEMLRKDIHSRSLREGDQYLTAAEASQMLGVSRVMANRAMNVLAGRRLLVRHRRRGTFVGPDFQPSTPARALRVLHVIVKNLVQNEKWTSVIGDCLHGLHTVLPGYQVQSNILPRHNPAEMVRQIFQQYKHDGTLSGFVLISCPREVQEMVQKLVREHNLPAVSFGTVYPNITKIPSLDHDQFESGRLQTKYLIDRGHRRIALLTRDKWLPGDNLLADGINKALADAGLNYGVLSTRSLPEIPALIKSDLDRLLSIEDRPTGLVCRDPMFAEVAVEVARSRSMHIPDDLDIICDVNDRHFPAATGLPRVCSQRSSREQLTAVAETLERIISGKQIENKHVVVPVELVEAE